MTPKSILLCVATAKGLAAIEAATEFSTRTRITVCTFTEHQICDDFSERIMDVAKKNGFEVISLNQWRTSPLAVLQSHSIDTILCVGWKYLIGTDVLEILRGNVVIAHDSLLPRLRGFAPLPTAMIAGDHETGVTFLRASAGVDAGPIYWQARVPICAHDTIQEVIARLLPLYQEGTRRLLANEFTDPTPQNESQATYSVWRDATDYEINWSESANRIERTIRALGPPYLGATTHLQGKKVSIQQATVLSDLPFAIRQPGKVWSLDEQGRPAVVCGQGVLRIDTAFFSDNEPLIPMKQLRVRFEY